MSGSKDMRRWIAAFMSDSLENWSSVEFAELTRIKQHSKNVTKASTMQELCTEEGENRVTTLVRETILWAADVLVTLSARCDRTNADGFVFITR